YDGYGRFSVRSRRGMKVVSRFEANLLRLLRFFLRRVPAEQAPLLGGGMKPPPCLSRAAVGLVQDALAKGTALELARAGRWPRERHVRGEAVVGGRLWERTPPRELGLTFSGATIDFLIWVTAVDPKKPRDFAWRSEPAEFASGDLALLYFAY